MRGSKRNRIARRSLHGLFCAPFSGPRAAEHGPGGDGCLGWVRVQGRSIPPPMAVNPISSGPPRVRCTPMGVHRTCGEPGEIKQNTHPKCITPPLRDQVARARDGGGCDVSVTSRSIPPGGGQFDFVWFPARTPHGGASYARVVGLTKSRKTPPTRILTLPLFPVNRTCVDQLLMKLKGQRYASLAVQFHPDGGQFDFARSSARTPLWALAPVRVDELAKSRATPPPETFYRSLPWAGLPSWWWPTRHSTRSAQRAVQFHLNGGQFDLIWHPARAPHGGVLYVW